MEMYITFKNGKYDIKHDIGNDKMVLEFLMDVLRSFMTGRCVVEKSEDVGKNTLCLINIDGKYYAKSSADESDTASFFSGAMLKNFFHLFYKRQCPFQ